MLIFKDYQHVYVQPSLPGACALRPLESGRQVNLARLSQESGVPVSTLKNYYQVLVDTFVGHWIPPYAGRSRKRLLTSPRFHLKWTSRPRPVDARHLETFLDEFPRRARRGLLVCRCPQPQQLTDRVTAIPWDAL